MLIVARLLNIMQVKILQRPTLMHRYGYQGSNLLVRLAGFVHAS